MPAVIVIGGCWMLGLALTGVWGAPVWLGGAALIALAPAALAGWLGVGPRVLLVGALVATSAAWRLGHWQERPLPDLAAYTGQQAVLAGQVSSLPDRGLTTTSYRFEVEQVESAEGWTDTDGALRLSFSQFADYREGERLVLEGRIEAPGVVPGFNYAAYLARDRIVGTMFRPRVLEREGRHGWSAGSALGDARLALEDSLRRALPEPEASLAAGIALGRDGEIPDDVYDDFRRAGLAHIVAVSGSNVALLTGIVFLALTPLIGFYRAVLPSFLVVPLYVAVAGAEASVVRAGVMAVVFLAALVLGRQRSGIAALAVAAAGMTALDPGAAMDLGFQMSLAATAGLLAFGPWLHWALVRCLGRFGAALGGPAQVVAWTVATMVATLPIAWLNFGQISLVGILANTVVEPVFAVALALSLLTAGAGMAWEPAGWLVGLAAYYPLSFITWVAGEMATWPLASLSAGTIGGTEAAAMYAAMVGCGAAAVRYLPPELPQRKRPQAMLATRRYAAAGAAGALGVAAWWFGLSPLGGPGELEVVVLDVGQGDAILVTAPNGDQVLVDGGRSGIGLVRELGAVMPHWDRTIEAVVLTHPQEDHLAGLPEVLERFEVDAVYDSGATNTTEAFAAFETGAARRQALSAGDVLEFGGVEFAVLWPPEGRTAGALNDRSVVIRVTYGETVVLLTGDIEGPPQQALMEAGGIEADVLKVPHHGSATNLRAFLKSVHAEMAVISVGAGNPFGHPREETLSALQEAAVYRTDERGRITIRSDGQRLAVNSEH